MEELGVQASTQGQPALPAELQPAEDAQPAELQPAEDMETGSQPHNPTAHK